MAIFLAKNEDTKGLLMGIRCNNVDSVLGTEGNARTKCHVAPLATLLPFSQRHLCHHTCMAQPLPLLTYKRAANSFDSNLSKSVGSK